MNIKDLKIVEKEISFSKMIDYVNYVVVKSFSGEDHAYHAYLRDFYEMVSLLTMYTNYEGEFNIDDIMSLRMSKEWAKLEADLGDKYYQFVNYIDRELDRINAPFAKFDDVLNLLGQVLVKVNDFMGYVSQDENAKKFFESFDTSVITDLVNAYANLFENTDTKESLEDNTSEDDETVEKQHS